MKYQTIDEAYSKEFNNLIIMAKSTLLDTDLAIDCVNTVFVKLLERKHDTGKENIKGFYLLNDVRRQAYKFNGDVRLRRRFEVNDLQHDRGSVSGRVFPIIEGGANTIS